MIKKVGKSVDISKKIDTATSKVTEFGRYREEGQWFCQRGRDSISAAPRTGRRRRQDVFDFARRRATIKDSRITSRACSIQIT